MFGGCSFSVFEIDFFFFNIEIGELVFIVIEYSDGCKLKILNLEVLLLRSIFNVMLVMVIFGGKFIWFIINEQGKLFFIVEQYCWNKWVQVGEVFGKGMFGVNEYEFQVILYFGENIICVVQIDYFGIKCIFKEVKFKLMVFVVEKNLVKVKDVINFMVNGLLVEMKYEVYDVYGNIVKKGVGLLVFCGNFLKGVYYINFDNKIEQFFKN